ncbi:PREDICTED: uncharacterized protein LOC106317001 [Brassica oleracea var. oleracea]|uniref:uncharacterized protein LOC106317001 n=1 Tax=Brassica oleracea var. oleracea TaxID=109376 RepID=UPI0006A721CC|nr:PREDICTED: uncharacterized protein LOC106317001 [Brassica oleracea var. oleracea]
MFGTISLNPSRWKDSNSGQHVEYGQRPDVFRGIIRYARCHAHLDCARSRRDDLESSDVYINISDAGNLGRLSWQEYQDDKIFCGLGMQNNIGHNKVNVEKRCSNH